MPSSLLDGRVIKRWTLDGKIIRKAYQDGKLCHVDPYRAIVASYGYGLDVNGTPPARSGFYVEGALIHSTGRSYAITHISPTNQLVHSRTFDTCGSTAEATAMATYLNAIPNGNIVIVYSHDEPQANRLLNGLQAAMERCGAGNLYSSASFQYRGAYALIGKAGVGKGGGYEAYAGSGSSALDAKLEVSFSYMDGVVSNIVRTL